MTTLTKMFTRERSLFYIRVWNDSDRMGLAEWLKIPALNSLFLREGTTNRISVWYNNEEWERVEQAIVEAFRSEATVAEMTEVVKEQWKAIGPFLTGIKTLATHEEFEAFFRDSVRQWSAMNIFYMAPNVANLSSKDKEYALELRRPVEQYSDRIDTVLVSYIIAAFPTHQDLAFVMQPEEAMCLGRGKLSDRELEEICKRLLGFALLNERVYLLNNLEQVLQEQNITLAKEEVEQVKEITGTPASKGFARGRVRQILLKSRVELLKEGEILVTEMTNPDFVPAMKRAAAIVTDEGGITSHAAIVSRELGKPCVIGTKIATKVLKDGMEVAVDAESGIVRIL